MGYEYDSLRTDTQDHADIDKKDVQPHVSESQTDDSLSPKGIKVIRPKYHGLRSSTVHIIPVLLSVGLLYLNFAQVYWFPTSGPKTGIYSPSANTVLNWLQLAAKLYEIFVVGSLAAITVKAFKRRFVENGVPLGLMTGPYRVGDVMYFLDKGFWAGLLDKSSWPLAALVLVNTLLSVLVGPASAILIVPEVGWFSIPGAFSKVRLPVMLESLENVWPTTLNSSFYGNSTECMTNKGLLFHFCPVAGYSDIFTWASGWDHSGLPDVITLPDTSGTVQREIIMHSGSGLRNSTFLTGVSALTAGTTGMFKLYVDSNDVGGASSAEEYKLETPPSAVNYQPLVNAKCNVFNLEGHNTSERVDMPFPASDLDCFSTDDNSDCRRMRRYFADITVPQSLLDMSPESGLLYNFGTISNEQLGDSKNSSLSSLWLKARLRYLNGERELEDRILACSYIAHWIPSAVTLDPTNSTLIQTNITDLSVFKDPLHSNLMDPSIVGPMISIEESWLPYMDLHHTIVETDKNGKKTEKKMNNSTAEDTMGFGALLMAFGMTLNNQTGVYEFFGPGSSEDEGSETTSAEDDAKVARTMEKFTGAVVTDAIARVGGGIPPSLIQHNETSQSFILLDLQTQEGPGVTTIEIFDNGTAISSDGDVFDFEMSAEEYYEKYFPDYASLDFVAERYGYGFGQSGPPRIFAVVVVFVYLAILFFYWIHVLIWKADTITPWGDVQDLITLAWSSPAHPRLKGYGVDLSDKNMLKEKVSVRSMASGQATVALEQEQDGLCRMRRNEKYW